MSRFKLTDRDVKIIDFLKNNKCADTMTLSNIFFNGSLRSCQHRLKKLCDNGDLKAFRENILSQNIYYVKKKPTSFKHALKVTQFIAELHKLGIEILKIKTPFKCGNLIADSLIICRVNGDVKILWIRATEKSSKTDNDILIKKEIKEPIKANKEANTITDLSFIDKL